MKLFDFPLLGRLGQPSARTAGSPRGPRRRLPRRLRHARRVRRAAAARAAQDDGGGARRRHARVPVARAAVVVGDGRRGGRGRPADQ